MRLRRLNILLRGALFFGSILVAQAVTTDKVEVEPTSTSIYIGLVSLHIEPLHRQNGVYVGEYKARVFPYFFMNEHGMFRLEVSDEQLARIARGETVEFLGHAENGGHEERKISGRASPDDASRGKIKVRIFVTEKIQLIFNTTYRFDG